MLNEEFGANMIDGHIENIESDHLIEGLMPMRTHKIELDFVQGHVQCNLKMGNIEFHPLSRADYF